jgi:transcriptional regulator with XRE-family HTH domain
MAENLWALREQKKISVAVLANRVGLPIGLIMEYESGQRSIDPRHLGRLARALYIEESDIKLRSDPRPGATPLERQPTRDLPREAPPRGIPHDRPMRPRPEPRPPVPPRPSQVAHLENLLKRLGKSLAELETEIGKPVASLDRLGVSELLKELQGRIKDTPSPTRHRAYLPESVDEFEAKYLAEAQAAAAQLHFTFFDGATLDGQIIGFGPYSITVQVADGAEVTINKLALVSYQKSAGAAGQEPMR